MFVLQDITTGDDGVAVGNHAGNQILQPPDAKRQQKTVGRHGSRFSSKVDLPCLVEWVFVVFPCSSSFVSC